MKKFSFLAVLVSLLALSLIFIGCPTDSDGGDGGDNSDPKALVVTNTPGSALINLTFAGYGLFPPGTTKSQVINDANAFLNHTATSYIVAGNNMLDYPDELVTTGSTMYTTRTLLRGANAAYVSYWTGTGTYDVWILLRNGTNWSFYKSLNVSITSTTTTLNAQTDFTVQ
jgi:hypothetical protein